MIKPESVPECVWHAAMSTYHKAIKKRPGSAWQEAFVAGLREWPGVLHEAQEYGDPAKIILPLPQENTDAEA